MRGHCQNIARMGYKGKSSEDPCVKAARLYLACDVRRPNISGEGDWVFGGYASTGTFTGSMYHVSLQNLPGATGGNDYYNGKPGIGIDASRSSSIYKASSTVQPASVRLLACIKI